MPTFSRKSIQTLSTCHSDLQFLLMDVIKVCDFTVLCGHRGKLEQERLFDEGKTQVHYPLSKHNKTPSLAVDIAPYPIDWKDKGRFMFLAGAVHAAAILLLNRGDISHKIRWGGDWNCNGDFKDQSFFDLPHFELIEA